MKSSAVTRTEVLFGANLTCINLNSQGTLGGTHSIIKAHEQNTEETPQKKLSDKPSKKQRKKVRSILPDPYLHKYT